MSREFDLSKDYILMGLSFSDNYVRANKVNRSRVNFLMGSYLGESSTPGGVLPLLFDDTCRNIISLNDPLGDVHVFYTYYSPDGVMTEEMKSKLNNRLNGLYSGESKRFFYSSNRSQDMMQWLAPNIGKNRKLSHAS